MARHWIESVIWVVLGVILFHALSAKYGPLFMQYADWLIVASIVAMGFLAYKGKIQG